MSKVFAYALYVVSSIKRSIVVQLKYKEPLPLISNKIKDFMACKMNTVNMVMLARGKIFNCVTKIQVLRFVSIFAIKTNVSLYLNHGVISSWIETFGIDAKS